MPSTGIIRNSGNIPFGTFRVTINGFVYIVDSITPRAPVLRSNATDEYGAIRGFVQVDDLKQGSMTLQFLSTASLTAMPKGGEAIVLPIGCASGSAFSASIENVSNPRNAGQVWTMDLDYVELSQGNS
jgi:hypothetical protein